MPTLVCCGCQRLTNSATSNFWEKTDHAGTPKPIGVATECYVAWVDGSCKVQGCGYDRLDPDDPYGQHLYARLLTTPPSVSPLP